MSIRYPQCLLALLLLTLVSACGGGGASTSGGGFSAEAKPAVVEAGLLTAQYQPSQSTTGEAVFSLRLDNLAADLGTQVGGISAELVIDGNGYTFGSFEPDPGNLTVGLATPLANDPKRLLIAFAGIGEGSLGTLRIVSSDPAASARLYWAKQVFISSDGVILPARHLTGQGGTLHG